MMILVGSTMRGTAVTTGSLDGSAGENILLHVGFTTGATTVATGSTDGSAGEDETLGSTALIGIRA